MAAQVQSYTLEIANRFAQMGLTPRYAPAVNTSPTFQYDSALFGMDTDHLSIPSCHRQELVLLIAERFARADAALAHWAQDAKKCVDFVEGKQWTAAQIAAGERDGRPMMKFNKIAPLIRLVLGYHRNNRIDIKFKPGDDSNATEAVADVLTKLNKNTSDQAQEPFIDTEVMMDGMITGRGYYDSRLLFEKNDFGEVGLSAKDPFTIRIDPDADTYDPIGWNFFQEARFWSIDEIEYSFGINAAKLIWPLVASSGYRGGYANSILELQQEIAPWRTFGGREETGDIFTMEGFIANAIDPYRKNVRVLETQWAVRVNQRCVINLETGDKEPVPDGFTPPQLMKLMQWTAEQYALQGKANPLRLGMRQMRRIRWTVMVGDLIVYDDWSPYETYTLTPYFPWFRRGKTRGMVEDLIGPQEEVNRRRNANIDIAERTAHSGWMYHERSLRESEKIKLEKYGAAAGINIEWRGSPEQKPEKIRPENAPAAMERLEQAATHDLKEIAGINDSALGQLDRVQSGVAIQARQKQSVLGIETYIDNGRRSKILLGRKRLEIYQNHYTEERIFRIAVQGGKFDSLNINKRMAAGEIVNDITIGKYTVDVDDVPLSSTFLSAQYEELVGLAEKGLLPVPLIQDIAVDLSSLPEKELIKQRLNAYLKAQGLLTSDELVAAMQAGIPVMASQIPPPHPQPAKSGGGVPPGAGGEPGKKEGPVAPGVGGGGPPQQPTTSASAGIPV